MSTEKSFEISRWAVRDAFKRVKANKGSAGVDGESIEMFEQDLEKNLYKLWNRMSSGSYFPPPIKTVEIPKDGGKRILGVPSVADRVAQTVVKMHLEPIVEKIFHEDSYGYRPKRSAKHALTQTRKRCWKYDWVIDLDIKGFFDNLDWSLLEKALKRHTNCPWILLYVRRWLRTSRQLNSGELLDRTQGTPQGGVISPLLANLFLHYAFDDWMRRNHSQVPFERYADDIVVHCETEAQATILLEKIKIRLRECKLECHPQKTKLVYCKDADRKKEYPQTSFTFLGYTFQPRLVRSRKGKYFVSFTPAISQKAAKKIRDVMRSFKLHRKTGLTLEEIAEKLNPKLVGWINYFCAFRKSALLPIFRTLHRILIKWAARKFKRFKRSLRRAYRWLVGVFRNLRFLFAHWRLGFEP